MSAVGKVVITLVGRTGDGKSAVGNELLKRLGNKSCPFSEGKSATSHTHDPQICVENNVMVVDNPGLMDTNGISEDENNITKIISKIYKLGHLNMLLLVVNAKSPRFDDGMQIAVKLLIDSFGKDSLTRFFLIYTNRFGKKDEELRQRTGEMLLMINKRCDTNLTHLPHFVVENRPENYLPDIASESVARLHNESYRELEGVLNVARSQTPYDTTHTTIARYEYVERVIKAKNHFMEEIKKGAVQVENAAKAVAEAQRTVSELEEHLKRVRAERERLERERLERERLERERLERERLARLAQPPPPSQGGGYSGISQTRSAHLAVRTYGCLYISCCYLAGLNSQAECDDSFPWCASQGLVRGSDSYVQVGNEQLIGRLQGRYGRGRRAGGIVDIGGPRGSHFVVFNGGRLIFNPEN